MSLHLYGLPSSRSSTPTSMQDDSSDPESSPLTAVNRKLKEELKKRDLEVARMRKEINSMTSDLMVMDNEKTLIFQKNEEKTKGLHKANYRIKELEKFCDKMEGEIASLRSALEDAESERDLIKRHLDSCKQSCTRLKHQNTSLEEKIANQKEEIEKLERYKPVNEQLMVELEQLREEKLELRRQLATKRRMSHRALIDFGMTDDEESPERIILDDYPETQDGVNLHQELKDTLKSPGPTSSLSCQFPSCENILEENGNEILVKIICASTQTDGTPLADSSSQTPCFMKMPVKDSSTQTVAIWENDVSRDASSHTMPLMELGAIQGRASGIERAIRFSSMPLQPRPIPMIAHPSPFERNITGSPNYTFLFFLLTFLCIFIAFLSNGGDVNLSPVANFFRSSLTRRYSKGPIPH